MSVIDCGVFVRRHGEVLRTPSLAVHVTIASVLHLAKIPLREKREPKELNILLSLVKSKKRHFVNILPDRHTDR